MIQLKIQEALSKDVGRAVARIDPQIMEELNAESGDIISIQGQDKAVARVMPTRPEDRGEEIIQMDGILRQNAKLGIGSLAKIELEKVSVARKVHLIPLTLSPEGTLDDGRFIKRSLLNLPIRKGNQIRVNLFGSGFQNLEVKKTTPAGTVMIDRTSVLEIEEPTVKKAEKVRGDVSYEDIGGLAKQVDRIREMVELPLKYPLIFEQLGIDPPRGVLLHGVPGTGKTLIARALANETDAYFTSINGPEVMSMFYGQSEANLRKIFNQAKKNQPSIIFIDEIDALAPKREEMTGKSEVEKRVVSQLLTLLDGLEEREQMVVIGATNIPDTLDPALRRPGRLDREIAITIPDIQDRKEILEIHTRGMPLSEDVDLKKMAEITHGFVGADIESLCKEAAMRALRRILPELDLESENISYDLIFDLKVKREDFSNALKEIEPSATREVFVEVPNVRWEDIGGLNEIKNKLRRVVEWPITHKDVFEQVNVQPPRGILLSGPPGTGKTLLAKAVANECEINFISVKGPELTSKWFGESEKKVRDLFKKARQASPCIIFLDEIDALAGKRGAMLSDASERITSQLLTELDGIVPLEGVIVMGATNKQELVDDALLRPGRLELILNTHLPDLVERIEILKIHCRGLPLGDIDFEELAMDTEGMNGADLEFICRQVAMNKIEEKISDRSKLDSFEIKIEQEDFSKVILDSKKES